MTAKWVPVESSTEYLPYFSGFSEMMVPLFTFKTLSNRLSIDRGLTSNVSFPDILHSVSTRASSIASSPF